MAVSNLNVVYEIFQMIFSLSFSPYLSLNPERYAPKMPLWTPIQKSIVSASQLTAKTVLYIATKANIVIYPTFSTFNQEVMKDYLF